MAGLEPRGFVWVIARRLALSERIGGQGLQHRRVRRSEELDWLREAGITDVLSLLEGNQNLASYREAGIRAHHVSLPTEYEDAEAEVVFRTLERILDDPRNVLLVHRDHLDDTLVGFMGGYLIRSGLIEDPIMATATIQEIAGRPLGPEGRRLVSATLVE
ncbi:MAG: hypothetical protein HKN74_01995 [Acidimicrobiia bacterium]|nr:hypothetical protein [Acidimicrobiia bacterium]MBT8217510.1 hypothetical protein [Acidimicrobiia bacterium]NNF09032.1 hypothetical protein [Acidimicrobiia bacterium]NNL70061.1 hypothetical protein [Acidimicrobiia bacterium]